MKHNDYQSLLRDFKACGIKEGDTVLVHSAMRTLGFVEGGAATVAKALIDAVGEEGTVVAPAFCFVHETSPCPLIDPENDVSEMGAISEAIRKSVGALRSIAYRHSVSAVGKNAKLVTEVDTDISPFDIRSSFGRMLGLDTKILLLGVPYLNCTSHHFAEYILSVPDRETENMPVKLKKPDGTVEDTFLVDYHPKANPNGEYYSYPHDFNRIGLELENRGLVNITHVGNAVARTFRMRDLIHFILDNYSVEYNLFAELPEGATVLPDGEVATLMMKDGADRPELAVWSVVNKDEMFTR